MSGYQGRGLHGQTVALLGARIVSGRLAQGEVLDLPALGAELDLSLTVLREAIKVLTAKGLLEARQKRGTVVLPRDRWNLLDADLIRWRSEAGEMHEVLRDLAEVRAVVEPEAAALAAKRRDAHDLEELEAALVAMQAALAGDPGTAAAADLRFHRAMLRATHNELLARMDVFIEPALSLRDALVHSYSDDDPVPSHARIVDAVRAADPQAAAAAARDLLTKASDDIAALLAERSQ